MTQEYESALRSAFVHKGADYIVVTSRREQFQLLAAWYGEEQGWLKFYEDRRDPQSTVWTWRLTEAGKKHFGLVAQESR